MPVSDSPWISIAARKKAQAAALIPAEWRLPPSLLPRDDGTSECVMHIPGECGLLSGKELIITEEYSARTLVQEMSSGRLKAVEVATAFCKRAAIAQQLTNCLTEPLFASAIARARYLDEYLAKEGKLLGPLHGLPVSVKDTFNIKNVDSSIGLAALCFKPKTSNARIVDLLLSLGCVVVAKTNIPQTLSALDSINNVFGRTMNPLNRLMTAGGSSGGEGVLVAMKGSMVGWGTDIGGSIRVPAFCNGIYGLKPSQGRVPFGGQEMGIMDGTGRVGIQAVAGPIARSVADIDLVMGELVPRVEFWGEDCIPGAWNTEWTHGSGPGGDIVMGIMKRDGNCEPLPPIVRVVDEVAKKLRGTPGVTVVEVPTPEAWSRSQGLAGRLMSISGGGRMADLLEATGEPLVPWMKTRFGRRNALSVVEVAELQAQRAELERQMLDVWTMVDVEGRRKRKIDVLICPVAPHPVPEIDGWNAVGYTSSFVLLDYPAGVVPVRSLEKDDLELGMEMQSKLLGSWDKKNRELWDERMVDRRMYLGTPLSIQVVTPKLHDDKLVAAMSLVDSVMRRKPPSSKL